MIRPDLVERSIIKFLQADNTLVSALGGANKIKEQEYQGQDFSYPNIRVDVQIQAPIGNGIDRTKLSLIHWTNRIYSEQPNSREANYLLGLVINAQFNKQWLGTDENNTPNFYLIRVDLAPGGSNNAIRIADKLWVATAVFQCEANPINPN